MRARIGRAAYRAAARAIALYNRAFHPRVRGCAVFVRAGERFLVVRPSYRRSFGLPGGRIARGERPADAAARELAEETGIAVVPRALGPLGARETFHSHIHDLVSFFELRLDAEPALRCDFAEIAEWRWVTRDEARALLLWPPLAAWLAEAGD